MALNFQKLPRGNAPQQGRNTFFLQIDNWDDYSHKTLFLLSYYNQQGERIEIGNIKIGYVGQDIGWTEERIPNQFNVLPGNFFSVGQDADYYINIVDNFSNEVANELLAALGDVAFDQTRLAMAENENVFDTSLLRTVNRNSIENQFRRIVRREAQLTEYHFIYQKEPSEDYSGIRVEFSVDPNSKPPSNIHVLIGRNGIGKTTLLNNMVDALIPGRGDRADTGYFSMPDGFIGQANLPADYFAGLVSVSFSAFDPFEPPKEQRDANNGMCYSYIGLKKRLTQEDREVWGLKDKKDLGKEFTISLRNCLALGAKRIRWLSAVKNLESDFNFADMELPRLIEVFNQDQSDRKENFVPRAFKHFRRMSSGHAVVLLTLTKLVETVEEKTLVLLDEPESHLHPPLLSAFTRALSELLSNRNGVAIIATHSPVVLQEVPSSSVFIIRRTRLEITVERPEMETFAENVGGLTREVFGLEVAKSGFHKMLVESVASGRSFNDIEREYGGQLGFEGKAILRAMITSRDAQNGALE
jgi:predicted ATPase